MMGGGTEEKRRKEEGSHREQHSGRLERGEKSEENRVRVGWRREEKGAPEPGRKDRGRGGRKKRKLNERKGDVIVMEGTEMGKERASGERREVWKGELEG